MKQNANEPEAGDHFCSFESADSSKYTNLIFGVTDVEAQASFKHLKEVAGERGKKVKQVDDMGDGTYFYEKALYVLKGKYFFNFMSSGNEGYELTEDAIKSLAKKAVGRNP